MSTDYTDYVSRKLSRVPPTGIASGFSVPGEMFPHQSALTTWAIRRGRAAIFADTGLGIAAVSAQDGAGVCAAPHLPEAA